MTARRKPTLRAIIMEELARVAVGIISNLKLDPAVLRPVWVLIFRRLRVLVMASVSCAPYSSEQ